MVVTVRKFLQKHPITRSINGEKMPGTEVTDEHDGIIKIYSANFQRLSGSAAIVKLMMPKLFENDEREMSVTLNMSLTSSKERVIAGHHAWTKCVSDTVYILSTFPNFQKLKFPNEELTLELALEVKGEFPPGRREKTWDFARMDSKLTDVALVVDGEKFHVSKMTLAPHSSFFYALFFGQFRESEQSEIELNDIEAETLQSLLEIVYLKPNIDADNVEALLAAARIYDMPIVTDACQRFLISENSDRIWLDKKEKVRLADEFGLEELKKTI